MKVVCTQKNCTQYRSDPMCLGPIPPPQSESVFGFSTFTLFTLCVCVCGGGICIWDRGLWPLLLINPGTPASEIGQKVTTLLSKCSGQAVGAGNKITLISHPCKFVFPLFCIYTHVPQKGSMPLSP